MNDKRIIENYKTVRTVEQSQPQPLKPEDLAYIKRTIEDRLAQAKANPKPETRSLAEIVSDIENDPSKSPDRKELELRIAKMADRMTHEKSLSVSDEQQSEQVSDEPLPLHEQLRFLRYYYGNSYHS
jgi:hypothetical protein